MVIVFIVRDDFSSLAFIKKIINGLNRIMLNGRRGAAWLASAQRAYKPVELEIAGSNPAVYPQFF